MIIGKLLELKKEVAISGWIYGMYVFNEKRRSLNFKGTPFLMF